MSSVLDAVPSVNPLQCGHAAATPAKRAASALDADQDWACSSSHISPVFEGSSPRLVTRGGKWFVPNSFSFDWLAFTLPYDEFDKLLEWFKPFGVVARAYGGLGYGSSWLVAGVGLIFFDALRRDMGVHVELSGGALTALAALGCDFLRLAQVVSLFGGRVTRLDVAFDDKMGVVNLDRVESLVRSRSFSGSARAWRVIDSHDGGHTVYVGGDTSEAKVRVYDKRVERGLEASECLHWVRVELQLRHDKADALFRLVLDVLLSGDSAVEVCGAAVRGVLDFRDTSVNSEARHAAPLVWWMEFLSSRLMRLPARVREIPSVWRSREWLRKQAAPILAFCVAVGDGTFVAELVRDGLARLRPEHASLLAAFNSM